MVYLIENIVFYVRHDSGNTGILKCLSLNLTSHYTKRYDGQHLLSELERLVDHHHDACAFAGAGATRTSQGIYNEREKMQDEWHYGGLMGN